MDEFLNIALPQKKDYQLLLATVGTASSSGVTLTFDGLSAATQKHFKRLAAGPALAAGDRVIVARMSGSYVVLGKIAWFFDGGSGYYLKNDTFSRGALSYIGCTAGGPIGLFFTIPVDKSLENISTITVTACSGAVRGPTGYVDNSTAATDWLAMSGYTVTAEKISGATHEFELRLIKDVNISGVDNNCVITGRLSLGLTFT